MTSKTPKQKMNTFIGSMAYQVVVFSGVIASAIYNHEFISEVLFWYVVTVGIIGVSVILATVLILNGNIPNKGNMERFQNSMSPSGGFTRAIGTIVSIIEFGIFVSVGWYWYALIWMFGDISQYLLVNALKRMDAK